MITTIKIPITKAYTLRHDFKIGDFSSSRLFILSNGNTDKTDLADSHGFLLVLIKLYLVGKCDFFIVVCKYFSFEGSSFTKIK